MWASSSCAARFASFWFIHSSGSSPSSRPQVRTVTIAQSTMSHTYECRPVPTHWKSVAQCGGHGDGSEPTSCGTVSRWTGMAQRLSAVEHAQSGTVGDARVHQPQVGVVAKRGAA